MHFKIKIQQNVTNKKKMETLVANSITHDSSNNKLLSNVSNNDL